MSSKVRWNPIAFTPWPVAFFIVLVYATLFSILLTFHNVVPQAPSNPTPLTGINLTEAWHDLQVLTKGYHPYNSHRNDEVRDWLLQRIQAILKRNGAEKSKDRSAIVFNDVSSNLTFSSSDSALSVAFTGTNIMVYIRGTEDDEGAFWERDTKSQAPSPNSYFQSVDGDENPTTLTKSNRHHSRIQELMADNRPRKGGVLVNAHFDSVPSGFGATDDGVGVISVLQLISYFSHPDHTPKRGIVALLNNGEEDYLNGAYAFSQHPISSFPHTFVNLEGAGAGGRADLFRSTDTEVTKFYKKSPYPFGTVISADGFKKGLVRSQTDYVVFNGDLGMRGLDIAFMEPRSRYHTMEDSTRYTSKGSIWHMLSSAIATTEGLSSDSSSEFDGKAAGPGKVESGSGTDAVWFDLFGRVFIIFQLQTLFAITVTLLIVSPLILIGLTTLLVHLDKWYPFSSIKTLSQSEEHVRIDGWRAFLRTPIIYLVATGAIFGLAFLLVKVNPYIIYSSPYAVWSMMLSGWFCIVWFLSRGAASMRPSALQRMYTLIWMFIGTWILLVGVAVMENNLGLSGGYFIVFYFTAVFAALLISYLELFALPSKKTYAELIAGYDTAAPEAPTSTAESYGVSSRGHQDDNDDEELNERTSLLRGDRQRTYASRYGAHNRSNASIEDEDSELFQVLPRPYKKEQAWSGSLPSWTWLIQFLILGPILIVFCGQVGLLLTSALSQTLADGSSVLLVYLFISLVTVLLLAPVTPFIHRLTLFLPSILFLIFIGTLLYNLLLFPFSDNARLKVFFVQSLDIDTGLNKVSLTGLPNYVETIISSIPSSAGQEINCESPDYAARSGLKKCSWSGMPPNVLLDPPNNLPPDYNTWMNFTATRRESNKTSARFQVSGTNTRACRLLFDSPVSNISVKGYATDPRFSVVGSKGCRSIRLWSREWGGTWDVSVDWEGPGGLDGRVVCLWSDANNPAAIPAYEEVLMYMPRWSVVTKLSDGLVEGWRYFKV